MRLNKLFRNCKIWIVFRILFSVMILISVSNEFSTSTLLKNTQTISEIKIKESNQANVYDFFRLIPSIKSFNKSTDRDYSLNYYGKFSKLILKEFKLKVNNEYSGLIKLNYFITTQRATST
jgi:hypothetical protein